MASTNGVTPIKLVPVCGTSKVGKPYLGINLEVDGDSQNRLILSARFLEVLSKLTNEQLVALRSSASKAVLWKLTHRAVRDDRGEVIVVDAAKAPAKGAAVVGDGF